MPPKSRDTITINGIRPLDPPPFPELALYAALDGAPVPTDTATPLGPDYRQIGLVDGQTMYGTAGGWTLLQPIPARVDVTPYRHETRPPGPDHWLYRLPMATMAGVPPRRPMTLILDGSDTTGRYRHVVRPATIHQFDTDNGLGIIATWKVVTTDGLVLSRLENRPDALMDVVEGRRARRRIRRRAAASAPGLPASMSARP